MDWSIAISGESSKLRGPPVTHRLAPCVTCRDVIIAQMSSGWGSGAVIIADDAVAANLLL